MRCFDLIGGRRMCEAGVLGWSGLPCQEPAVDFVITSDPGSAKLWLCAECFDNWIEEFGGRTPEDYKKWRGSFLEKQDAAWTRPAPR